MNQKADQLIVNIPAGMVDAPGDSLRAEHRVLGQLNGKTIRKAVLNTVENDKRGVADLLIACTDGTSIEITVTGSLKLSVMS